MIPLLLLLAVEVGRAYEVDHLYGMADRAYRSGQFVQALGLYGEVHRLEPSYRSAFNLAVSAEQAGMPALAFSLFESYLSLEDPDPARKVFARELEARLASGLAVLEVRSAPPRARVYVGRRAVGSYGQTPVRVAVERPGPTTVELELDGYRTATVAVTLERGERRTVDVGLVQKTGGLVVEVDGAGAPVTVVAVGPTGTRMLDPGKREELPVGTYEVRASADGRQERSTQVSLRPGAEERRRLQLEPLPDPTGTLLLSTGTDVAEVRVDGVALGRTPAKLELPVGPHRIELWHGGERRWTETIEIHRGVPAVRLIPLGGDR